MRGRPGSVRSLEEFGRVRLSASFFMRDFLHSEIADFYGIPNIPDDLDLAIAAGCKLCEQLLEPLQATFGRLAIRSAYRAPAVNEFGKRHGSQLRIEPTQSWPPHLGPSGCRRRYGRDGDRRRAVVADRYRDGADWRALAWWIHDHLPYSQLQFFPKLAAFNIGWHEQPTRRIDSFIAPKGCLTRPGLANHNGSHAEFYSGFPRLRAG
jgi:hypothetical protein